MQLFQTFRFCDGAFLELKKVRVMFSENLINLRKLKNISQEELAEKLNVSRQTISKWETGESLPDIEKTKILAELFNVSIDDLVNFEKTPHSLGIPPKGKYAFGVVTVGEKGQITLPAKARKIFDINPGDNLILLGDETQGIGIIQEEDFLALVQHLSG